MNVNIIPDIIWVTEELKRDYNEIPKIITSADSFRELYDSSRRHVENSKEKVTYKTLNQVYDVLKKAARTEQLPDSKMLDSSVSKLEISESENIPSTSRPVEPSNSKPLAPSSERVQNPDGRVNTKNMVLKKKQMSKHYVYSDEDKALIDKKKRFH